MHAIASTTEHPAKTAGQRCTSRAMRMPARPAAEAMCSTATCASAATSSIILMQTGVHTSVSLFVLLITIVSLLLVVLISLSGLTGLVRSLVGLITGLVPDATMGD